MRGVVLAHVRQIEPLRIAIVELHCAQLPRATDRVGHIEVDLRAVERAVAFFELVRHPRRIERCLEARLGAIPHLVRTYAYFWTRREFQRRPEAERLVVLEN